MIRKKIQRKVSLVFDLIFHPKDTKIWLIRRWVVRSERSDCSKKEREMIRYTGILASQLIKTHLSPSENSLQQARDKKCKLQISSRIMKTHSVSQRVSEAPQKLSQDRLQQERDGNDQVHTNTSFANNQTHVAKRCPTSGC